MGVKKTHCKNGHIFDTDNTYRDKNGWRICKACMKSRRKPYTNFSEVRKEKHKKIAIAWRNNNREWHNVLAVLRTYNLTLDQYHALQEKHDFHCAICDRYDNLHVDHDHATGEVRGLLCHHHNVAIGFLNENIEDTQKLIEYLRPISCQ